MSTVIPTVLSPARVSHALASVGPPAGSASLRLSTTDPLAPGNGAEKNIGGRPRSTSPSRAAATAFPIATVSPGSPTSIDASLTTISPFPIAPAFATATHSSGGSNPTAPIPTHRTSGSGTGEPSSAATSARSLNSRRLQTAKSFRSHPDSPKTSGSRVQLAQETSSASFAATQGSYGNGGGPGPSPIQRAYMSNGGTNRSSRGGLGRDRSFAGSVSSATGNFRPQHGSNSGGYVGPLDSLGSALGGLGRGGSVSLQPAPGTVGGIDIARLAAIQRLLDEYDSDDAAEHLTMSPRAEGSSYRQQSDSADSGRHRTSDSGSGTGSASGLRKIASLRSRKDMQHWQPAVSTVKCSLEEHQQRLRERADVTLHLKRWAEQVLEDARRAGEGGTSARGSAISRAASVRFTGVPEDPGAAVALAEFVDPEQELDDEEERRLETLMALPPNPRGLGAQLRAHFMAVVEEEVNKKIDVLRAKWEVERGNEAEELRELRDNYRDLRRMHIETKDALDKANTRLDVMRLQMRATVNLNKPGKDAAAAADGDGAAAAGGGKSSLRSHRSSTHDGGEGKGGGKGGKGSPSGGSGGGSGGGSNSAHAGEAGGVPSGAYGHEDELHDKLKNIGSRRVTSPTGDGSGEGAAAAEPEQLVKAQTEVASTLNPKLQETEQQVAKLQLDEASLENQLAARSGSPEPESGGGAHAAGTGDGASASSKYDTDIQIFKLKQEKASLEQQLATAKSKSSAKGGIKGASGGRGGGGGSSRASTPGKSATAGKTAELTAEVERLNIELAAAKRLAANSSKEATNRRMEHEKTKNDLTTTQTTLDMAMQQLEGIKDAISREKERADKAAVAAEAAEEAQAQAEASAAAANSAVAATLIKRSAATGEVQELLGRLERERDAAAAAAAELRQKVREMSKSLGQQAEDMMRLRDEMLKRQLENPASSALPEDTNEPPVAAAATPPAAASPATGRPPRPPPLTIDSGGLIPSMQSKVTAAAMAAMQSLGLPLRATPVAARRRPTSALGHGGGPVTAGFESAVGVAAAAAAAAALVPAVLEVLRQRVPDMVMGLEGDLEDKSGAAAMVADVGAGAAASADAAAVAAAAAAATLRESGNAAAAAAAGATASAPIIASTFVDLVRAELLHGGTYTPTLTVAAAKAPATARSSSTGAGARVERPESLMAGNAPAEEILSEQLDELSARSNDRLYVFHKGTPPAMSPVVTNAGGPTVSFAEESAKQSAAAGVSGVAVDRPPPPAAVVVDGVTFYPLGVRESPRATRRPPGLAAVLPGGHELIASLHNRPSPSTPLPHHTPYFDAAAAAVAAAAADLLPQSVSVPMHGSRSNPASSAIAAAARRRRSAFAQLHSNYFTLSPAVTPTSSAPDPNLSLPRTPEPPDEEDGDGLAAATSSGGGGAGSSGLRERLIRSAGYYRDSVDGLAQDPYYSVYVDPELASVLHVEQVSPAAARAAGAGRGAISPEALGPSLRDRALSTLQAPEPLPPPVQRPQSAAVRTLDAARQYILHHGGGGGGRFNQLSQTLFATLPPLAGATPAAPPTAPSGEVPGLVAAAESGGGGIAQSPQSGLAPLGFMSGVKVRAVAANPQKGVQLSSRLRAPRQPSARGMAGRSPPEGVRFEDEEAAAAKGPSVSGRLVPGLGLSPVMREVQLHTGTQVGNSSSGTYLVQPDADAADGSSGLPSSSPELAALARSLMAAQERAIRELEEAMSTRRELAEEVLTSRQQWLEEARRACALENELEGVRAVLASLGIGGQNGGAAGAANPPVIPQLVRASGAGSGGSPALSSRRT